MIGVILGVVLTSYAIYTGACSTAHDAPSVSGPANSEPVAAAPAPAPTATPTAIAAPPADGKEGREVSWGPFSSGDITNTSGQTQHYDFCAKRPDLSNIKTGSADVGAGKSFHFDLGSVCDQLDITQNGCGATFLPIEAAWYGLDGVPVNHPTKVDWKACYPDCVEKWVREQEPEITYGEWGTCQRGTTQEGCYKKRTVTKQFFETNTCTRERRKAGEPTTTWEYQPCECPCVEPEQTKEVPGAFAWTPDVLQGKCEKEQFPIGVSAVIELNCHQIGTQKIALDYVCKEDGERILNLCRNVECPCVNVPTTRTTTDLGPWSNVIGQCGSRTKTVTTYTKNSCTGQETSVVVTTTETKDCGACYYRVSCGDQSFAFDGVSTATKECTDQQQQAICEAQLGGFPLVKGIWRNFGPANLLNHCQYVVPGVSNNDFQLNPGQSDPLCFNKKD